MSEIALARQPIFDRDLNLAGYELLYRASALATTASGSDSLHMSSATIIAGVLDIGLDELIGDVPAWIKVPQELLREGRLDVLDPKRCVIELLEAFPCGEAQVALVQDLVARGFTVALDDMPTDTERAAPILGAVQVFKIDTYQRTEEDLDAQIRGLGPYRAKLLAERVESAKQFALCRKLGFQYFQGYYFSRPEIVQTRNLSPAMAKIAQLMNQVLDPAVTERELDKAFRQDPALSVKLLKIVNTASMGGTGIESILQAIRMVGRQVLHRWLALLLASMAPRGNGMQAELVSRALERARLCERLGELSGQKAAAPALFLTGLLSTLDVILGIPLPVLLTQIRVSPDVQKALLEQEGAYAPYLALATQWADGEFDTAQALADGLQLTGDVGELYRESCTWARDVQAP